MDRDNNYKNSTYMRKNEHRSTHFDDREERTRASQQPAQKEAQNIGNNERHTRPLFLLTPEQAQRFLEAAKGDRLEALYVLALTTGMRRSELLALKWEDIDYHLKRVQVRRTIMRVPGEGFKLLEPKIARRQREIPLMSLAIDAIERHCSRQQEAKQQAGTAWDEQRLVFCNTIGRPLEISTLLARSFRPLVIRAELPLIKFHDMRNGTAALLIASGVPAQVVADLLGYSVSFNTLFPVPFSVREEAIARLEAILTRHN